MEDLTGWLTVNWQWVLIGFFALEKAVKLTPWKQDDILFDMVFKQFLIPVGKKIVGKK